MTGGKVRWIERAEDTAISLIKKAELRAEALQTGAIPGPHARQAVG